MDIKKKKDGYEIKITANEMYDKYDLFIASPHDMQTEEAKIKMNKILADALTQEGVTPTGLMSVEVRMVDFNQFLFNVKLLESHPIDCLSGLLDSLAAKITEAEDIPEEIEEFNEEDFRKELNNILPGFADMLSRLRENLAPLEKSEINKDTYVYEFEQLNDVIRFAKAVKDKSISSKLYKDTVYYMIVDQEKAAELLLSNLATEYLGREPSVSLQFLEEHAQKIIKEKAIESLSNL